MALELAETLGEKPQLFLSRLHLWWQQSILGRWADAAETWRLLDPMGRDWPRHLYRQGDAELLFASTQRWQGTLAEHHLTDAAARATRDNNRQTLRDIHRLRGQWRLEQAHWTGAATAFAEALRMARERRLPDPTAEAGLALAKLRLGRFPSPAAARQEAEHLAAQRDPHHRTLAELWMAIGDQAQARHHALAAYREAWGQGAPWVFRYDLDQAARLLRTLGEPPPDLPPYDPATDPPFPWEAKLRAAIARLRAEGDAK